MFGFGSKRKEKKLDEKVDIINSKHQDAALTSSFEDNISLIKKLFTDNDMLRIRMITNSNNETVRVCLFYTDGLVSSNLINDNIVKPLMLSKNIQKDQNLLDTLLYEVIQINEAKKTSSIQEIIKSVTYGDTILLVEGEKQALILNSKYFTMRSVTEPYAEQVLSGPREGFSEPLLINLSMLWRKLRTNELKMKSYSFGERSNTQACICYIDGIVNKKILGELYRRLDKIKIDGVLDSNYISELIRDFRHSPFYTIGKTERPDVVAAKLLEGRIALFVDGTPVVLTLPYLFIENFQANEDYYVNYYYASFYRMLRIVSYILTISVPGSYIALVAYHKEVLPTTLLVSVSLERHNVPFPAVFEVFMMLIIFEVIKETGIRIPSNIGQALSIVGALVIGQAAVEAKLVAAPVVIIIAVTALTGLLTPKLSSSSTYIRLILLLFSSIMGFYGLVIGIVAVILHLYKLKSFGVNYMVAIDELNFQHFKDILIRAPWWKMKERPAEFSNDKVRLKINDEENDG